MTPPLEFALRIFHLSLLRGASLLVPRQRRSEWSQEWNAELWYVLRECSSATRAFRKPAREATAFCLGAYADAFCLRRQLWQKQSPFAAILKAVPDSSWLTCPAAMPANRGLTPAN